MDTPTRLADLVRLARNGRLGFRLSALLDCSDCEEGRAMRWIGASFAWPSTDSIALMESADVVDGRARAIIAVSDAELMPLRILMVVFLLTDVVDKGNGGRWIPH